MLLNFRLLRIILIFTTHFDVFGQEILSLPKLHHKPFYGFDSVSQNIIQSIQINETLENINWTVFSDTPKNLLFKKPASNEESGFLDFKEPAYVIEQEGDWLKVVTGGYFERPNFMKNPIKIGWIHIEDIIPSLYAYRSVSSSTPIMGVVSLPFSDFEKVLADPESTHIPVYSSSNNLYIVDHISAPLIAYVFRQEDNRFLLGYKSVLRDFALNQDLIGWVDARFVEILTSRQNLELGFTPLKVHSRKINRDNEIIANLSKLQTGWTNEFDGLIKYHLDPIYNQTGAYYDTLINRYREGYFRFYNLITKNDTLYAKTLIPLQLPLRKDNSRIETLYHNAKNKLDNYQKKSEAGTFHIIAENCNDLVQLKEVLHECLNEIRTDYNLKHLNVNILILPSSLSEIQTPDSINFIDNIEVFNIEKILKQISCIGIDSCNLIQHDVEDIILKYYQTNEFPEEKINWIYYIKNNIPPKDYSVDSVNCAAHQWQSTFLKINNAQNSENKTQTDIFVSIGSLNGMPPFNQYINSISELSNLNANNGIYNLKYNFYDSLNNESLLTVDGINFFNYALTDNHYLETNLTTKALLRHLFVNSYYVLDKRVLELYQEVSNYADSLSNEKIINYPELIHYVLQNKGLLFEGVIKYNYEKIKKNDPVFQIDLQLPLSLNESNNTYDYVYLYDLEEITEFIDVLESLSEILSIENQKVKLKELDFFLRKLATENLKQFVSKNNAHLVLVETALNSIFGLPKGQKSFFFDSEWNLSIESFIKYARTNQNLLYELTVENHKLIQILKKLVVMEVDNPCNLKTNKTIFFWLPENQITEMKINLNE